MVMNRHSELKSYFLCILFMVEISEDPNRVKYKVFYLIECQFLILCKKKKNLNLNHYVCTVSTVSAVQSSKGNKS